MTLKEFLEREGIDPNTVIVTDNYGSPIVKDNQEAGWRYEIKLET